MAECLANAAGLNDNGWQSHRSERWAEGQDVIVTSVSSKHALPVSQMRSSESIQRASSPTSSTSR